MAGKTVKSKGPAVNQVEADIRSGALKNLYLIYGEETELKRIFSGRLIRAIGNEEDGMNFQRFEGRAATVEAIIDAADTLPFFAQSRTVLVKESGLFKTKQDELADYLKDLPESTYLIFVESEVDKKFRLFKAVESIGCAQEYVMLTGDELRNEVARRIARAGFKVRSSTVDYFLEQTGADLTAIQNQLDKVCAYAQGEITKAHIDAVATKTLDAKVYALSRALLQNDFDKAYAVLDTLMQMRVEPYYILGALCGAYLDLYRAKTAMTCAGRLQPVLSAYSYKGREFALQNASRDAARLSTPQLRKSLEALLNADRKLKSTGESGTLILEQLLVQLSLIANGERV